MKFRSIVTAAALGAAVLGSLATAPAAFAQAKEQFFPVLVYRTGAYAPNGVPFADGYVDYLKLVNATGGINGVKAVWEECETGYATDKGVECYERLKGKNGGATVFQPLSTGITFALTEKAPIDKIPLITSGYGRSESADGMVFKWNFPLWAPTGSRPTCWCSTSARRTAAWTSSRARRSPSSTTTAPTARKPIPILEERAKQLGFELLLLPVTHPGVEQKSTWLQIRQERPDYVFLWGWGVMNSTAIKEAVATGYPREKMYGVWWSGAEPDVKDVGAGAKGYNALALQHGAEPNAKVDAGHPGQGLCQGRRHRSEGPGRPGAVHARRVGGDARRRRRETGAGTLSARARS